MSETPNNKPSNNNRRSRNNKAKPRSDSASANGQSGNAQNANSRRRPAQKSRRPQNQGRQQRTADNFGNQINGHGNGNRRNQNGNRAQTNGRKPQGQNRNGNNWHSADSNGFDQYRSSDWYREDQARFAAQQIAIERAEAKGENNKNQNKRNQRNNRPQRNDQNSQRKASPNNNGSNPGAASTDAETAQVHTNNPEAEVADTSNSTSDSKPEAQSEAKGDSTKREAGKSRRAPWRTQKHATALAHTIQDKSNPNNQTIDASVITHAWESQNQDKCGDDKYSGDCISLSLLTVRSNSNSSRWPL